MIQFFSEDIDFKLSDDLPIIDWINQVVDLEKKSIEGLTYVFCSDSYLHNLNVTYLSHDTLTDIITFPYHESGSSAIEGDIFISINRVKENAKGFETSFVNELHRVIIHGALHLCGYKDKTEAEEKEMRRKENEALKIRSFLHTS